MQWTKRYASHFGGTRNGMVMSWPRVIKDVGGMRKQFHHVVDISATILDAAGVPSNVTMLNGVAQKKMDGTSMRYTWDAANVNEERRRTQVFEMFGNRGIYADGWMACTTPVAFAWEEEPEEINLDSFKWELYNLDMDFTQGVNLVSKEHVTPEYKKKLEELKALWWAEAGKSNILPLNFSEQATIDAALTRPSLTRGRTKFEYYSGISRIPEGAAPPLKNCSYHITAYIRVPDPSDPEDKCEGTIITQGGRFGGWGLVMMAGKPVWVYKLSQMPWHHHQISWDDELSVGDHKIEVTFSYEGGDQPGGSGLFSMRVDDQEKVKTKHAEHTVGGRFSVNETLDVGMDTGTPILDDYTDRMPFKFKGTIGKVVIELTDVNQSDLAKANIARREAKFAMAIE